MEANVIKKIKKVCSYVCNGKTYKFEQKLKKAVENELYDSAIIYTWKIFMLFIYEKLWQIREIEKIEGTPFKTDQIFLPKKDTRENYFDGSLFALNKLDKHKQGDDALLGKLNEVFTEVDPQIFKVAQQILKIRHEAAHQNSIDQTSHQLNYVFTEVLKVMGVFQGDHEKNIKRILGYEEDYNIIWHLSKQDDKNINKLQR